MTASRLVLSSGLVVDGTGREAYPADVVLDSGRLDLAPPGSVRDGEWLDCAGHHVLPGFVDIHTHSDLSRLRYPDAPTRILQGVTTEVIGNCGMSPAPLRKDSSALRAIIGPVDVCPDLEITWPDLAGYLETLEATPGATNVVPLLGHGSLRQWALGAGNGEAGPESVAEMAAELLTALDLGVWGLSLGLMYAPGERAGEQELVRLARVVGRHGGLLSAHMRNYDAQGLLAALQEVTAVASVADVALQVSHLRSINDSGGAAMDGALAYLDSGRSDVGADAYPYLAGHTTLLQLLPSELRGSGPDAVREAIRRSPNMVADRLRGGGFAGDAITVARCGQTPAPEVGRDLGELATARGSDWATVAVELLDAYHGNVDVIVVGSRAEDTMKALLHPRVCIASDGLALDLGHTANVAHPRSIGTFPRAISALLAHGLSAGQAVHKATMQPARRVGLSRRGQIAPGMVADVVVCSLPELADNATYREPLQPPSGVRDVFVQGTAVVREGQPTGARPGVLLRKP